MSTLVEQVKDPIASQKAIVAKETLDVEKSLSSIEATCAGILEKEDKYINCTDKVLKKKYKHQIKESNKYLATLYDTLALEVLEKVKAVKRLMGMRK